MSVCPNLRGVFGVHAVQQWSFQGTQGKRSEMMPAPTNVSSLRSFLGAIQFYNKFLPNMATSQILCIVLPRRTSSGSGEQNSKQLFKVSRTYSVLTLFWLISTLHFQLGFHVTLLSVVWEQCCSTAIRMAVSVLSAMSPKPSLTLRGSTVKFRRRLWP